MGDDGKLSWPWIVHRLAHVVAVPLRMVRLRRLAFWVHDRTMPKHRCWVWDLDFVPHDAEWRPADTERNRKKYGA